MRKIYRLRWLLLFLLLSGKQVYAECRFCTGKPVYVEEQQIKEGDTEEAESVLQKCVDKHLGKKVVLQAGDGIYVFTAQELGLTWANAEIADAVRAAAEEPGSLLEQHFYPTFDINRDILRQQLEIIIEKEEREAVNGTVYRDDNGYPKLDNGVWGRHFSLEQAMTETAEFLVNQSDTEKILKLAYTEEQPQFCGENTVFSETPLGEYTTYNLGMPGRVHNIELSAGKINGTLLMPGEEMSALNVYGAVTAENGYQEAPVYNGGRQLMGIGGGICQTTTTLYNACLLAELEIVYRRQHSMLVSYVPPSLDAMVDYATGSDFIVRNSTGSPVYLEASTGQDETGRGYVNIRIWGVETRPANRTVEYTYEVLACDFPQNLFRINAADDSLCTVGLVAPDQKIYAEVECHPFVQSRAYKVVKVDGVVQSCEALPGTYGSYDQYRAMEGTIYHASDCLVTYWVVEDASTYLGKRVHYEVMFLNGHSWDPDDPAGWY